MKTRFLLFMTMLTIASFGQNATWTGTKTFGSTLKFVGLPQNNANTKFVTLDSTGKPSVTALPLPDLSNLVHKTGEIAEDIDGVKTFTENIHISDNILGLSSELATNYLKFTNDEGRVNQINPSNSLTSAAYILPESSGTLALLSDIPTVSAQIQPDWNATSGLGEILNKPSISGSLEKINEGSGFGYRLAGVNAANYGNIGSNAIDLSQSGTASTLFGATGEEAFCTGWENTASGPDSFIGGGANNLTYSWGSSAWGYNNKVTRPLGTAIGIGNIIGNPASPDYAGGFGYGATCIGFGHWNESNYSTIVGIAGYDYHVDSNQLPGRRLFVVGNGVITDGTYNVVSRSNAFEVQYSGKIIAPSLDISEIIDAKCLTTKEYVDSKLSNLQVYPDNASAITAGLVTGNPYRTATGQLMIVY